MEDCIMKKVFIALAILAAAVFTSCNREKESGYVPKENGIAFYLQGISTKSAETSWTSRADSSLRKALSLWTMTGITSR